MRAAGARRVGRALVPAAVPRVSAETPAARPLPGNPDPARPLVLAAGRLAAQKGFGTLLEAAAGWRDLRPEPLLVIAGEGPLEASLKSQAARLGLDARFAGHRDDIPALLAAAAVFVLPSTWEGQPLILQEALRAGVPIVATRVGGTPVLTGEDAAVLVPPGDARRLADAVRAVLTDEVLAARLRKAAAARGHALPGEDDAVTAALAEYKPSPPPHLLLIPRRSLATHPGPYQALIPPDRVSGERPRSQLEERHDQVRPSPGRLDQDRAHAATPAAGPAAPAARPASARAAARRRSGRGPDRSTPAGPRPVSLTSR